MALAQVLAKLSAEDKEVINKVVHFVWLASDQIGRCYGVSIEEANERIHRLRDAGLLLPDRRPLARGGAIWTHTRTAAKVAGVCVDDDDVNRTWVYHHLTVVDVADALIRAEGPATWVTERELRRIRKRRAREEGRLVDEHMPDGVLVTSTGRSIAIEVELNDKHWIRHYDACHSYGEQFGYHAIRWYVTVPSLHQRLPKLWRELGLSEEMELSVHNLPDGVEERHK